MSDATDQVLTRAYELIEADRLSEAELLLKPVLENDPDNVDAWWLYSHAVTDVETARMALNTVLKLDPDYPGARDLLGTLEEKFPGQSVSSAAATQELRRLAPPPTLPDLPDDDDMDDPLGIDDHSLPDDDDFVLEKAPAPRSPSVSSRPRRPRWLILGAVALTVILAALLFLLLREQNTGQTATPTAISQISPSTFTPAADETTAAFESAQGATIAALIATEEVDISATDDLLTVTIEAMPLTDITQTTSEASATSETAAQASTVDANLNIVSTPAAPSSINAVEAALADFDVVEGSIGIAETALGSTLLADVCSASGQILRDTLYDAMNALSSASETVDEEEAQAMGLRLVNCTTGEVLRVIAVPINSAVSYTLGDTDEETFQAQWVAVA